MTSLRISKDHSHQIHFITCTVERWYYLFDRYNRWDILSGSLNYCIANKELKVHAYVFMLNHIHLSPQESIQEIDYKLQLFLQWYNFEKRHNGLDMNGLTPIQKINFLKSKNVNLTLQCNTC